MLKADVRDGYLWIVQTKARTEETASKIRLPLKLRINALALTVEDAIKACQDSVLSRYVLHHNSPVGGTKPGSMIPGNTFQKWFAEARIAAGITGAHPPTFHEIRSLAARLYAAEGKDAQTILGHKSKAMTELYKDMRGQEWLTVSI